MFRKRNKFQSQNIFATQLPTIFSFDRFKSKNKFAKFLPNRKFPAVVFIAITIIMCKVSVTMQLYLHPIESQSESIGIVFLVVSECVTVMTIIIQLIIYRHEQHQFIAIVNELIEFTLDKLRHRMCFRKFWIEFSVIVLSVVTFHIVCWVIFVICYANDPGKSSTIVLITLFYLRTLIILLSSFAFFFVKMHSFLIDLLLDYIKFNHHQRQSHIQFEHTRRPIIVELNIFKRFHLMCWSLAKIINRIFGFSFLLQSIQMFIDVAYSCCYMFVYATKPAIGFSVMRKQNEREIFDFNFTFGFRFFFCFLSC